MIQTLTATAPSKDYKSTKRTGIQQSSVERTPHHQKHCYSCWMLPEETTKRRSWRSNSNNLSKKTKPVPQKRTHFSDRNKVPVKSCDSKDPSCNESTFWKGIFFSGEFPVNVGKGYVSEVDFTSKSFWIIDAKARLVIWHLLFSQKISSLESPSVNFHIYCDTHC